MIVLATAIALFTAQAGASSIPPKQEALRPDGKLDGHWGGGMTVPAGLTIPFELEITGNTGKFAAPDQHVSDLPIVVHRDQNRITIDVPAAKATFVATLTPDMSGMSGEWRQGTRAFPAEFKRGPAGLSAAPPRPQTPVDPLPYAVADVTFPGGSPGVVLAGTLTQPEHAMRTPAFLLLGGNGPQDRDETYAGHKPMRLIADRLTRAGIAVLRFDKRGVGSSTGRYANAGGTEIVADARAALAWLRAQPVIDRRRVCILGLSEGATAAPIVAADGHAACVVLLSAPGLAGPALIAEQTRLEGIAAGQSPDEAKRSGDLVQAMLEERIRGGGVSALAALASRAGKTPAEAAELAQEMSSPEVGTFLALNPAEAMARLTVPALVVAGSLDRQVPPAANLPPIRRALASDKQARVIVLTGLNHLLQPAKSGFPQEYAAISTTMDERALTAITRFATAVTKPVQ